LDEARGCLKKAKGRERLEYIISLDKRIPETNQLTESGRNFINMAVVPVLKCFEKHHGNDKEQFSRKWPSTGVPSTFRKKCCDCKGNECGIH
jgi:hypothetical protein